MNTMFRFQRSLLLVLFGLAIDAGVEAKPVDPPCDKYPPAKQPRCTEIWKELNLEDGPIISQFGLDQLKRREEGKITAQQHLAENMAFIKQSTEKRLERLNERMAKE
jgi:hypothetical protein